MAAHHLVVAVTISRIVKFVQTPPRFLLLAPPIAPVAPIVVVVVVVARLVVVVVVAVVVGPLFAALVIIVVVVVIGRTIVTGDVIGPAKRVPIRAVVVFAAHLAVVVVVVVVVVFLTCFVVVVVFLTCFVVVVVVVILTCFVVVIIVGLVLVFEPPSQFPGATTREQLAHIDRILPGGRMLRQLKKLAAITRGGAHALQHSTVVANAQRIAVGVCPTQILVAGAVVGPHGTPNALTLPDTASGSASRPLAPQPLALRRRLVAPQVAAGLAVRHALDF